MTEELDILRIVADNPSISQRRIAEKTGISLGQVNFLIKKCAKKGLIKIEGQTTKSIRYNLTPKGIAEKAALTLEYIKISYGAIMMISDKVKSLIATFHNERKKIYIFGHEDEMMGLIKTVLSQDKINYTILDREKFEDLQSEDPAFYIILCWSKDATAELGGLNFVNVLE